MFLVDLYVLDVVMSSPPKELIPAHGSSRSTRGTLRGHAAGNTFNIADVGQVFGDSDGEPTKGKIYLYISDLNPWLLIFLSCLSLQTSMTLQSAKP